jgi:hypothetical protein
MVDPVSATALIIAVLSGIGSVITQIHINKCKSSCCESDCTKTPKNSPPNSPSISPSHTLSTIEKHDSEMYHKLEELIKGKKDNEKEINKSSSA